MFRGQTLHGEECTPHDCNLLLRQIFQLPHEFALTEVPFPSYKVTPVDHTLSVQLECEIEVKNVVIEPCELHCITQVADRYFNWERYGQFGQRQIPTFSHTGAQGAAPYLQFGWLDSVGIYKQVQGMSAVLVAWETEMDVRAFDHVPLRAIVCLQC